LRDQLGRSAVVRRHLARLEPRPDALHMYTHNAALLSVDHMRRIPTVVSLDATNRQNAYRLPQRPPTRFTPRMVALTTWFEERVYDAAARVATHSRWAADSVLTYGVPAHKIEVVPFGITLPECRPHVSDGGAPKIVFVGTSMARKGGWRLVGIWRRRLAACSRLVLVTPEPVPAEPGLEVHNDVRPGDGRLEQIFAEADLFAMPGEIDSFGYGLIEAMAASLPAVAVGQAAVPEIVDDGVTGLLVPPGDDDALAASLQQLIDDGSARQAMGAAGRTRVVERFDARLTTAAVVELLRAAARA
jgi:glycosyltransferase involved in cell wall biosynthesis